MYGAEFSLYSGKLRSYLRKKGIEFTEIQPWLMTYKRFIVPRTGVRYIPVLQTPEDDVWQDTTVIIDHMEERFPQPSVYPATARRKLAALILELFGDEWLLLPAMHYRWNYPEENLPFIYGEFGKLMFPRLPVFLQRKVGKKLGDRFRNAVPRLGITEETIPALESWYEGLLRELILVLSVRFTHTCIVTLHPEN
jgi:glutathione S-transferase